MGEEHSYLWAVTPSSLHSYVLPKRAEIEKAARHVSELLLARQPKAGETPRQYHQRVKDTDVQYWQEAGSLSQMLLGPVLDQLGSKRLLIVAEGALQYLPFGALPKPYGKEGEREKGGNSEKGSAGTDEVVPLIFEHEIVNLPSASVMAVLRRETRDRPAPAKMVAVLADPVFETDDPRLIKQIQVKKPEGPQPAPRPFVKSNSILPHHPISTVSHPQAPVSELQRALRDVGMLRQGMSMARLPGSRQEAEAIMSVTPAGAGMMALDFMASRATATSPELGQYRIVHFATHGLLNSEHPELSGLVLSLVNEQGQPQDGFLRLHDIYNLNLPADLVVLSACNSGLGKEIRGEGLVGIVRGFMYAGAARVIASLWKVEDDATAELMKRFYQHMLQSREPAAAALRAAQVEMWQQKQWKSPYYWAAFVLQGEWR